MAVALGWGAEGGRGSPVRLRSLIRDSPCTALLLAVVRGSGLADRFYLVDERAGIGELAVDGRKTDIGHLVQPAEALDDLLADVAGAHLTLKLAIDVGLDGADDFL